MVVCLWLIGDQPGVPHFLSSVSWGRLHLPATLYTMSNIDNELMDFIIQLEISWWITKDSELTVIWPRYLQQGVSLQWT